MSVEQEINEGLKVAFKEVAVDTTGSEFANLTNPNIEKTVTTDSSLKPAEPVVETAKVETIVPVIETEKPVIETVTKSFDEELTERLGGKYKSFDELKSVLDAPKEELDEEIKHLAELKKSGVNISDPEFLKVLTTDYAAIKDPFTILLEAMRLEPENKGISDKALMFKMKEKYQYDKWSQDESEDPTEVETIMAELVERDSELARAKLIERKTLLTTPKTIEKPDAALLQKQAKERQDNFEKYVDEQVVPKMSKLSTTVQLDDKTSETFDFDLSDVDKKEISNTMKLMTVNMADALLGRFADKDGNIDHTKVFEMLAREKNYENALKVSSKHFYNKGLEAAEKKVKNITFNLDGSQKEEKADWRAKAQAQAEKHL